MNTPLKAAILVLAATVSLAVSGTAVSQTPDRAAAAYNRAGALYHEGRFGEAFGIYDSLAAKGVRNPDLFYNAGNAAFRSNRIGKAVLFFERARRLSPSDADILANIDYLNSRKQDKDPAPGNPIIAFLERRYAGIGTNRAAAWSGAMFAAMMALLAASLFFGGWKRISAFTAAGICGVLFVFWTGILIEKTHREAVAVEGVIIIPELNAYSGPGEENTHIFTVHEGTVVTVERMQDAWSLVRLKSGVGGWVRGAGFEKI